MEHLQKKKGERKKKKLNNFQLISILKARL